MTAETKINPESSPKTATTGEFVFPKYKHPCGISVRTVLDSVAHTGKRVTTLELKYPRFIHSEFLTHRDRARNSASSRAIPAKKMRREIIRNPVIPVKFGAAQKRMVDGEEVKQAWLARRVWLTARLVALFASWMLSKLGVHKNLCNRLTEPWMFITVICTATEWKNFLRLRNHPDAENHIQILAALIDEALHDSEPILRDYHQWHMPYVNDMDRARLRRIVGKPQTKTERVEGYLQDYVDQSERTDTEIIDEAMRRVSVARCARVSFLTHHGTRSVLDDLDLFGRLTRGSGFGHWSPMEHVATPANWGNQTSGPFHGWIQYRKQFQLENEPG